MGYKGNEKAKRQKLKLMKIKYFDLNIFLFIFLQLMICNLCAQDLPIAPKTEEVKGFVMTIVDRGGKDKASISGSKANLLQGGMIEILEAVARIYSQEKGESDTLVHTSKALYNKFRNNVTTDQFVRINRRDMVVTGTGLQWMPEKTKLNIDENVRIEYLPGKESEVIPVPGAVSGLTVITSKGNGMFEYSKGVAVLNKNVVVDSADTRLVAHKMKIFLDQDTQKLSKVEAYGDVKIKQQKRESSSRKAVYFVNEDRIELTGSPKIVQGLDLYTAQKVTIYDKGNRVVFEPKAEMMIYMNEEKEF
jgi:lipopolysaccharide transport protein LptA